MTQDQLFTLWQSAPNNIPQPICVKLLAAFPQLLSDTNPVTWTTNGSNYKATFTVMDNPCTITLGPSPKDGQPCILKDNRNISQEYLPNRIKEAIKELYPNWSGTGVASSPVYAIRMQIITNGNPLPLPQNVYNAEGVDATFDITFDNLNINNTVLKSTAAYNRTLVKVVNKQGDIL